MVGEVPTRTRRHSVSHAKRSSSITGKMKWKAILIVRKFISQASALATERLALAVAVSTNHLPDNFWLFSDLVFTRIETESSQKYLATNHQHSKIALKKTDVLLLAFSWNYVRKDVK